MEWTIWGVIGVIFLFCCYSLLLKLTYEIGFIRGKEKALNLRRPVKFYDFVGCESI